MKNFFTSRALTCLAFLLMLWPALAPAAPFTPGNIVVVRIGDGTAALTAAAQATFLLEYTPTGTLVQTIALPTAVSGTNRILTETGTSTSDAGLTRSADGRYLVLTGYDAAPGTAALAQTSATTTNRIIGRIAANGSFDTSTRISDTFFSTAMPPLNTNIRSAATNDGTAFYAVGSAGGVRYLPFGNTGATTALNTGAPGNNRVVNIFGGNLYVSSATTPYFGISQVGTGLPTTAPQTVTELTGFPTATGPSPYGFYFADLSTTVAGLDVVYVADDRAAPDGGIQKWSNVGGTWTLNGTVNSGATTTLGLRGVTGSVTGTTVSLVASGNAGLFFFTDNAGYNATPSTVTLPTATTAVSSTGITPAPATNTVAFRGVAFAPAAAAAAAPTITSFTPTSGTSGTTVTVTGTNFTGATAVKLNGVTITGYTVVNGTTITFTVPSGATSGTIAVTTAGGTATSTGSFTVIAAPTITSFTPTSGAAGTTVTVTGTNFTGATALTLNGTPVLGFTVVNATTITFVVPVGASSGTIAVTTAGGTATSTGTFTVIVPPTAPTITSFTPSSGVAGTTVTFTGTSFTGTTAVTLNGTAAPGFAVNAAGTQLTVNVPVGATTGTFSITSPGGTATSSSFTVRQPSAGRILLDGYRESRYGVAAALQTAATGFGNSTNGSQTDALNGSELDGAYTRISGDSLYVFLAGNIESNGNLVDVFFDSQTGGQNVLTNTNPNVDNNGLNNSAGLTFDTGFTADYYLGLKGTPGGITAFFASLGAGGVGQSPASSGTGRVLALNLGNGRAGTLAFDQSNTGGVDGNTASAGLAGAVVTGLEFVLPLSALGAPVGLLRVAAFVNNGSHDFLANQVLAGVPAGTANLATASAVNFNTYAGNQYFSVAVPAATVVVTSFSPGNGPVGTAVTITGSGFTGTTSVNFGGTIAPGFVVNAAGTSITVNVPAGASTGAIGVTTASGTGSSSTNFTVTGPTAITSITPTSGVAGTSVTITGSNFTGTTAVSLNGTAAPGYVVNAAGTSITLNVPVGATTGTFSVTAPSGTANSSNFTVNQPSAGRILLNGYRESRYGAAAALQTAATGFGNSTNGSQTNALNGSELDGAYTRISGDSLYVFLAGNIENNGNIVDVFFDSQTGGQNVLTNTNPNVDGNGLNNSAGLTFDTGFAADYYLGLKGTTGGGITAFFASLGAGGAGQSPASSGTGQVLVLNLGNGRAGTLAFDQSNTGGVDGNTASAGLAGAVVTGLEFVLPLSALGSPVGSLKVAAFVNNGSHDYLANQTLAGLPAGTPNLATASAVNFNTYAGNQYFTVAVPASLPTISSFTPTSGASGATVTITGTNFIGATAVTLNGAAITGFTVVNGTTITFTVPATATNGTIAVTTPGGTATSTATFTVTAPVPAITSFTPTSGPVGTTVTVTGTNFTGATSASVNGTAGTNFMVMSASSVMFDVAAGSTSGVVRVITPGGTAASSTNFTVTLPAPTITSFTPTSGPIGTLVTVNGTNFAPGVQVDFGAIPATTVTYVSSTQLTVVVPAGATTGFISVTVGTSAVTSSNMFTVTTPPTITSFTPTTGATGSTVTITGTNFNGATAVTLNGATITGFAIGGGGTTITFTVPATATSGPIAVTTPGGTATSTGTFTVAPAAPAPTITGFTPARAVAGSGPVTITINGTNLVAGATATFNGTGAYPLTPSMVGTPGTSATVTLPASVLTTAGTFPITVTNSGGTSGALTFLVVAPATSISYEDFEIGAKTSYAAGPVTLRSGIWTFDNALVGNQFNDKVNQVQSARLRPAGFIAMNFDKPNGAGVVTVNAALYGADAATTFKLEISTDGGTTYTLVPGAPAALTATLTPYNFTVNQLGPVRFRITNTTPAGVNIPRINVDDLSIPDYFGAATLPGHALPGLSIYPNPTQGRLAVVLTGTGAAQVAVRDLTGRVVLPLAPLAADKVVALPAGLASGVYLLEVRQGGETAVRRITKE